MVVALGNMMPNTSNYVCRITLLMNKDGSHRFYGEYKILNMQT